MRGRAGDQRESFLGLDAGGWRLFWAQGFSGLGTGPFIAFSAIYQRQLGASALEIGLVAAFGMVVATLVMLPGTRLAENQDLRATVIAGWLLAIPAPLTFALAPSWQWTALGVAFLMASVVNTPAINVYLTLGVPRERIAQVMTTVLSSNSVGLVISTMLAGWLAQLMGIRPLFFVSMGCFCLGGLCIGFLPKKVRPPDPSPHVGYRQLFRYPAFPVLTGLFTWMTVVILLPWTFTPLYAKEAAHAGSLSIGALMSILYLGSVLVGLSLSRLRRVTGSVAMVLCFQATYVVSAALLLSSASFPILTLAFFLRGAFWSFRQVMTAVVGEVLPYPALAKGYGVFAIVTGAAAAVAYPLGGWMYARDPGTPFWSSAVLMAFGMLATVVLRSYFRPGATRPAQPKPGGLPEHPLPKAA